MLGDQIDGSLNVKHALTNRGTSEKQGGKRGNVTAGALFGAAALAKATLLDGQSAVALLYDLNGEIAVAAGNGILIARKLGSAERDVIALGMSLQADHHRRFFDPIRQPQMARHKIAFFRFHYKPNFPESLLLTSYRFIH